MDMNKDKSLDRDETMGSFLKNNITSIGTGGSEVQQTRIVINNVLTFLTELKDPLRRQEVDFNKPRELTALICGVSLRTVDRIRNECKAGKPKCPRVRMRQARPVTDLDDLKKSAIKRIITSFSSRERPTVEKIVEVAKKEIDGFKCSNTSMARILKDLDCHTADKYSTGKRRKILKRVQPKPKKRNHDKEDKSNDSEIHEDTVKHGGWWKVEKIQDAMGPISIEFGNNAYISTLDNGLFTLGAPHDDGEGPSPEEIFTAFPAGENKFALKSPCGEYLGVSRDGTVIGRSDAAGLTEQWEPVWEDGYTVILSSQNKLISVGKEDDLLVALSVTATDREFCTIRSNKSKEINKSTLPEETNKSVSPKQEHDLSPDSRSSD